MTLQAGTTLGPYRILEQIGKGGMAVVYKAHQAALARFVAIKVLPGYLATEEGFRERFQSEAVTLAKLRHPNILQVFDFGEEGGVYYIVSEFVDGGTLQDQLGQPLPADYVVRMLTPVASALDYAHARGLVHRDVKPSNVLIGGDGTPVVSDFGLARIMMGSLPRLTQTGALVGTPEYMSPEQAAGEDAGPAADRYALAVIAYEMLTGSVPYSADTPLATLVAHLHRPLPLPRERNPALAASVEQVLLKGLAKQAADRFARTVDFVRALERADTAALVERPAPASPVAGPPLPTPVTRSPATPTPTQSARVPTEQPATTAPSTRAPTAAAPAGAPSRARGISRRAVIVGAVALVGVLVALALAQRPEEDLGPPLLADVQADVTELKMSDEQLGEFDTATLTVNYSANRDATFTDVLVVVSRLRDGKLAAFPIFTTTPEGDYVFDIGDLGPWASGTIEFQVYFTKPGSRIVEVRILAREVPAFRLPPVSLNVKPRSP